MTIMLDKVKNSVRGLAGKVAQKATEVNSKMAQKNPETPAEQYIVGLDVGTEFVKALIGKVVDDGIEIVGVGRAHQGLSDMQAGAIADIAGVVENCDKALAQAEAQANISVRTAVIGIAGELVKGTTTTVRVTRKEAGKALDLAEVQRIIKLVQQRAEAKAKKQLAWELGGKEVEVKLVNSALVGIEIDGYKVTSPIGFQGKEVVVQLYTAFAPLIHIGALERTAQQLDLDLLAVAAEPFAVARSIIGDDTSASMNAILMDVGGGTTDIAVITDGGVQGTKMFGIGGRAFSLAIGRELDVDFPKAESLKLDLTSGHLAHQQKADVEKAINKTLNVWTSGVELALSEFDKLDNLPHRVLLCGGGSSLSMLMDRLENDEWHRSLPFTRKPIIQHIKPDEVIGITDATGDINDHTYITAMGLLRVGMDTLGNGPAEDDQTVKNKLNKLLKV
jgi:cell division protein FtsA